tara:strand:- start:1851 stop:2546 length:696 start_codon:yes stop_codon:yes gene_type:complete
MKGLILLLGVVIVLGLVGAGFLLINSDGVEKVDDNEADSIDQDIVIEQTPTECVANWTCKDNKIKAYQLENCSYEQERECPLGCINNTCKASEVCEAGFKCKGENYRAYQSESCAWLDQTRCDYGCNETSNACKPEPVVEEVEEEEQVITISAYQNLKIGETNTHTIGTSNYNLSIYNIDADKVQLTLNGKRSNWLNEGNNYTSSGAVIMIEGIYFQAYAGGKKEIDYTIT